MTDEEKAALAARVAAKARRKAKTLHVKRAYEYAAEMERRRSRAADARREVGRPWRSRPHEAATARCPRRRSRRVASRRRRARRRASRRRRRRLLRRSAPRPRRRTPRRTALVAARPPIRPATEEVPAPEEAPAEEAPAEETSEDTAEDEAGRLVAAPRSAARLLGGARGAGGRRTRTLRFPGRRTIPRRSRCAPGEDDASRDEVTMLSLVRLRVREAQQPALPLRGGDYFYRGRLGADGLFENRRADVPVRHRRRGRGFVACTPRRRTSRSARRA